MRLLLRATVLPATFLRNGIVSPNVLGPFFSVSRSISTDTDKAPPIFKKPISAYNTFIAERVPLLMAKQNEASSASMLKKAAQEWRELSDSVKQTYIKSANVRRENYLSSLEAHVKERGITMKELTNEFRDMRVDNRSMRMKRKLRAFMRENNYPRRPESNGFALFVKEYFKKQPPATSRKVAQDIIKAAAEAWKQVPEDAKKVYNEKAADQLADFQKKVEVWKAEMIQIGAEDVVKKVHLRSPLHPLDEARIEKRKQEAKVKLQRMREKRLKLKERDAAHAAKALEKLKKFIDAKSPEARKQAKGKEKERVKTKTRSEKESSPTSSAPKKQET